MAAATPIPLGFGQADKLWVVRRCCGYSRFMAAWMVPTRAAHDVLAGMLTCFAADRGDPPHRGVGRRGLHRPVAPGQAVSHRGVPALPGHLGMGARLCKPNDPEAKGMNERANGYYETSFLPDGASKTSTTSTAS